MSFGTELTNTAVHSSSPVTFISSVKRAALKIPVYFRLLTNNWTCQSDISLSLSSKSTKQERGSLSVVLREKMDLVLPLLQSWGINRAERRPSAHSADARRVWHSEAIAPSLRSDANLPFTEQTLVLSLVSFSLSWACLPLSFSSLVYKSVSL